MIKLAKCVAEQVLLMLVYLASNMFLLKEFLSIQLVPMFSLYSIN